GVQKAAIIFLTKTNETRPDKDKPKKAQISVRKVSKEKFYEFKSFPKKSEWKDDTMVPFFNTLASHTCENCKGKGAVICKKCGGQHTVECPDCSGKGKKCKQCDGSGKYSLTISVYNEKGDKVKKDLSVKCNNCHGSGTLTCAKCGGTGKIPCQYCKAQGTYTCSECDGYGVIYQYEIKPVPFKHEHRAEPMLFSSIKLSGLEKQIGQDIQATIDDVEGIKITKPDKQLDKKFIEPSLGYIDKDIQKMIKSCRKEWKNAESSSGTKILLPFYLFPVFVLNCETKKGKKFQVYGIGSENKYHIYGEI
ncbi:MAG: hypothetical protein ACTSYI_14170, partial [Promethearchaeota archaeon]